MGNRPASPRPKNARELTSQELLSVFDELAPAGGRLVVSGAAEPRGMAIGQYVLEQKIGSGAFGNVYHGRHRRLNKPVALKVLQPHLTDRLSLARFRREMRAQALLTHPGFACAIDAFVEHGAHCLVMEFVDGFDLHSVVNRRGRLAVHHSVEIVRQTAEAMDFAHSIGMIHRDLKPGNLMVDREGAVRVMDLGLAKCSEQEEGSLLSLTRAGVPMGTVDYLAPEQAGDAAGVTSSADIYSLGCTLHCLLCGHAPFPKGTLVERLIAHQKQTPPRLDSLDIDVPPLLADLVHRMLAKRPADRPASMRHIVGELHPWLTSDAASGRELLREFVDRHARGADDCEVRRSACDARFAEAATFCGPEAAPPTDVPVDLEAAPITIVTSEAPWRTRIRSRQSRRGLRQIFKSLIRHGARRPRPR